MRFYFLILVCALTGAGVAQSPSYMPPTEVHDAMHHLQAYWLDGRTLAIPERMANAGKAFALASSVTADLQIVDGWLVGGTRLELTGERSLSAGEQARFPQLKRGYRAFELPGNLDSETIHTLLTGQLAVSATSADGQLTALVGVQSFGVLDALFAYDGRLGVVLRGEPGWQDWPEEQAGAIKLKLWAPTAQTVRLNLYRTAGQEEPSRVVTMHRHGGVWVAAVDRQWLGSYYLYDEQVYVPSVDGVVRNVVSDPYSIDLALNGKRSRLTDVHAASTEPANWRQERAPRLDRIEDLSIYELHIRDFSVADQTVPAEDRGTYLAFTDVESDGMRHLRQLAGAGLKAVHLLPSFHFNSVDEDRGRWQQTPDLAVLPAASDRQRQAVQAVQSHDGFNWGYDPVHYLTPEGAYAVDPGERVLEYRKMVAALHRTGLRVIQDVVFNHTSDSGQGASSILDKVVPNYYYRLDGEGRLMLSTCCADTASEHRMMAKLQQDAIVWQARTYKVDGFRFDLMGFTFIDNLTALRRALDALTLARDGVDGKKIYLYGEGWEMGETAHNALGRAATQQNLAGTGVGSFNDRLRDGVRGGSPGSESRLQGFATGLGTQPSAFTVQKMTMAEQEHKLLEAQAWIRAGLTGNLSTFPLRDAEGNLKPASEILYNGQPAGYTAAPRESVNYVGSHDDLALFDAVQIKAAEAEPSSTRARRQQLALSIVTLGQGIPFFMAGDDMLRSKDMDADSYDSGDWFNQIDWTGRSNRWGVGLPIAHHDRPLPPNAGELLADARLLPTAEAIATSAAVFQEGLRIRMSSPLFRLATAAEVRRVLRFPDEGQRPGVITMELRGESGPYRQIVVLFNASAGEQRLTAPGWAGLELHPIQRLSRDPLVRQARVEGETLVVPALTTAVFVRPVR